MVTAKLILLLKLSISTANRFSLIYFFLYQQDSFDKILKMILLL